MLGKEHRLNVKAELARELGQKYAQHAQAKKLAAAEKAAKQKKKTQVDADKKDAKATAAAKKTKMAAVKKEEKEAKAALKKKEKAEKEAETALKKVAREAKATAAAEKKAAKAVKSKKSVAVEEQVSAPWEEVQVAAATSTTPAARQQPRRAATTNQNYCEHDGEEEGGKKADDNDDDDNDDDNDGGNDDNNDDNDDDNDDDNVENESDVDSRSDDTTSSEKDSDSEDGVPLRILHSYTAKHVYKLNELEYHTVVMVAGETVVPWLARVESSIEGVGVSACVWARYLEPTVADQPLGKWKAERKKISKFKIVRTEQDNRNRTDGFGNDVCVTSIHAVVDWSVNGVKKSVWMKDSVMTKNEWATLNNILKKEIDMIIL
jgi:hypothetical protein